MKKIKLAVFISGRGSNLQALYKATERPNFPASIGLVISDNKQAKGYMWARDKGIKAQVIDKTTFANRAAFEKALLDSLTAVKPELVVLAGFMSILSAEFIKALDAEIINIHPSLLPKYPGLNTHERVLASGDKQHGCSVHYVTETVDAGDLIGQKTLDIAPGESPAALAKRVLALEHQLLAEVVEQLAIAHMSAEGS